MNIGGPKVLLYVKCLIFLEIQNSFKSPKNIFLLLYEDSLIYKQTQVSNSDRILHAKLRSTIVATNQNQETKKSCRYATKTEFALRLNRIPSRFSIRNRTNYRLLNED